MAQPRTEERVDEAEELLCAGLSPGRVERKLAQDYAVSTRQARKYISRVYARWEQRITADAPHRREKVYRMAERFYAKALVEKQYTAAANALGLLAKLSGALTHDVNRENPLAALGPVPTEPTEALIYAQKAMVVALSEVVANPSIDPERRLRWISEIGGKIGMTHAKALVQQRLSEVARRVLPQAVIDDGHSKDSEPAVWAGFTNAGSGDAGADPLSGSGAGPTSTDD